MRINLMFVAELCLDLGDATEAYRVLSTEIRGEVGPAPRLNSMFNMLMARALVELDEPDAALDRIMASFEHGDTIEDPTAAADRWRVLGLVISSLGGLLAVGPDDTTALTPGDCFHRAATEFPSIRCRALSEARTYAEWAKHERKRGRLESALQKAEQAKQRFLSINAPLHLEHHGDLFETLATATATATPLGDLPRLHAGSVA